MGAQAGEERNGSSWLLALVSKWANARLVQHIDGQGVLAIGQGDAVKLQEQRHQGRTRRQSIIAGKSGLAAAQVKCFTGRGDFNGFPVAATK